VDAGGLERQATRLSLLEEETEIGHMHGAGLLRMARGSTLAYAEPATGHQRPSAPIPNGPPGRADRPLSLLVDGRTVMVPGNPVWSWCQGPYGW
jgi:hypothetical protein